MSSARRPRARCTVLRCAVALALAVSLAGPAAAQGGQENRPAGMAGKPIDVIAINKSKPVLCAEHDNVHIDFVSPDVRQFQIQARHPTYIASIRNERAEFDLANCSFHKDPVVPAKPRKKTFWESRKFWLTGYTFGGFWRANNVPVRVGNHVERGFHMVQLWMLHRERAEEVMVFYPPDGYWRARPLPFADMRWTAYGSSFLVGPVEFEKRPLVRLKEIEFDPAANRFTLHFMAGGSATITLKSIDQKQITLDVAFPRAMPRGLPFASLRSMYVTETNSDVARLAWRSMRSKRWLESPVMEFKKAATSHFWAGRRVMSRHNQSAPDFVFRSFAGPLVPAR